MTNDVVTGDAINQKTTKGIIFFFSLFAGENEGMDGRKRRQKKKVQFASQVELFHRERHVPEMLLCQILARVYHFRANFPRLISVINCSKKKNVWEIKIASQKNKYESNSLGFFCTGWGVLIKIRSFYLYRVNQLRYPKKKKNGCQISLKQKKKFILES